MTSIGKFGLLALLLILAAVGAGAGYDNAGTTQTVDDEEMIVNYNEPVEVLTAGTGVSYHESVTILDQFDSELEEGTDYEWNASNGSVTWLDTAATESGETTYITYAYDGQSDQMNAVASLLRLALLIGGFGLVLAGGRVAIGWTGLLGGGGGR